MRVTVVDGRQLDEPLIADWQAIQAAADMRSPHFSPQLVRAAAEERPGVEVAVLEDAGRRVGFFPYHRHQDVATPYAGALSDLQGVITRPGLDWDVQQLLMQCRLKAWHFNRLLASHENLAAYHTVVSDASFMDLSQGFEAYRENRRQAKSDELKEALRKGRKIERDHGPLQFVPHSTDVAHLQLLLQWKSEQLRRMKVTDFQDVDWTVPLLTRVQQIDSPDFAGMCNVVTLAGRPIAISMGMRSVDVVQGWVTAFDGEFYKYSPGLILFSQLAMHAESLGVKRIDMGCGPESFKKSFRTGTLPVAEGAVETSALRGAMRRFMLSCKDRLMQTPLGSPLQQLVRRVRYWRGSKPAHSS